MPVSLSDDEHEARVEDLVAQLTVAEQASLTGGQDVWHLPALERLGIGRLKMSDGPSGVRGEWIGTRRSLSFPCGMAVGATWDVELVGRYGTALGAEARSKGVHLLLGPTVCIPRTPLGGRTFESFAEDPWLSSRLTVAYVRGVQDTGVGCCVKHFACNDQEHERMTISVDVDDATLREVHLPSFEAAVGEAGVWAVMSAYNRVDGTYAGEHPKLLGEILKDEWGFDGVVVSDWFGTHSTVDAAQAGLDVEMPGRPRFLGKRLATAVDEGEVTEAVLTEHARRILRLVQRTGLLDGPPLESEAEDDDVDRRAIARELAIGGTVLLQNDGLLPLPPDVPRVAVIGPNGDLIEPGGGGSSSVVPHRYPSFVDALRALLPATEVTYERGCRIDRGIPPVDPRLLGDGLRVSYFDTAAGGLDAANPVGTDTLRVGRWIALGDPYPGLAVARLAVRATATFTADADGPWELGLANAGGARLFLDGSLVVDNTQPTPGHFFYGQGSSMVSATVDLMAGEAHELTIELVVTDERQRIAGFELAASRPSDPHERDRAVAAAAAADAVIVVVGSNGQWETEGGDRPDLHLVGEQEALVAAVLAANPRTAVVVNAGSPVDLAVAVDAAALVQLWYPGEEGAPALADVVTGAAEPGGRLPITIPKQLADAAAHVDEPRSYPGVDGTVTYVEGLLIGHRHLDAAGIEPAFAFGHGLTYTSFTVGEPTVVASGSVGAGDVAVRVTVPVTNTGERTGAEVVQLYVGPTEPVAGRPRRELKAFAKVRVEPGETAVVELALDQGSFRRWDAEAGAWTVVPESYDLSVGTSSRSLPHHHVIGLTT